MIPTTTDLTRSIIDYLTRSWCDDLGDLDDPDVWWDIAERLSIGTDPLRWAINHPQQFADGWILVADEVAEWEPCHASDLSLVAGQAWIRYTANAVGNIVVDLIAAKGL